MRRLVARGCSVRRLVARGCSARRWLLCAPVGGGPPARSPHASYARSARSRGPPWPRHRPPAPQPPPARQLVLPEPTARPPCGARPARPLGASSRSPARPHRPRPTLQSGGHYHLALPPPPTRRPRVHPFGRQWGFCSIRNSLPACRRRVGVLMTPFPPLHVTWAAGRDRQHSPSAPPHDDRRLSHLTTP